MKKSMTMLLMLTLSIAIAGCSGGQNPATVAEEQAVSVELGVVEKGSIEAEAGIVGTLAPNKTVQVSPEVSGVIKSIDLKIGQAVNQGDVLFTLDQQNILDSIKQAKESYNMAVASLKQAEDGSQQSIQQAESGVDQAHSALIQRQNAIQQVQVGIADAENANRDAQSNLRRTQELFAAGVVSQSQLEQAQTAAKQAQSALENANLSYKDAQTALKSAQTSYENAKKSLELARRSSGVQVAKASINQARVALETAQSQLSKTKVVAPISGTVSAVSGTTGLLVGPQAPVVTIANTSPILVKVNLAESEMMDVKVGSSVSVEVPSLNKKIDAKITALGSVMDQSLKAYPVEISVDNPDSTLRAGMMANVYIQSGNEQGLLIPQEAVTESAGVKYVYTVDGDKAKRVAIETGSESSTKVEVTKGLAEGQSIIVKGISMLSDGSKISVVNQ
ncbi:efflux RND transporter periplasmic adaptor subunit [Paenibacillus sanguinis]|uniref:efflux RND transporter periplasmic adaptor subunit n=1 Tax=Paenibacillus sanguinis TaxID=225906 RepID=UPI000362A5DB|nr:efflux RND transporter periplasmic adaptor subunit [Paenibacillus sanguinis]